MANSPRPHLVVIGIRVSAEHAATQQLCGGLKTGGAVESGSSREKRRPQVILS